MINNIAYVASTLPISVLNRMAEEWNIGCILVASAALGKSYSYLSIEKPYIKIIVIPRYRFLNFMFLICYLCTIKFSNRKIYFFHECCCFYFDLLLGFIKPKGEFYPQVTLDSFSRINFSEASPSKTRLLIHLFRLDKAFVPYLMDTDDNTGKIVVWSRISYPFTVIQYSVAVSSSINSIEIHYSEPKFQGKILFVVGAEVFDNDVIRDLYYSIIDICTDLGFRCFLKDHPNPHSRLSLEDPRLLEIDPYMPVELATENYDFVIGVASTALLKFQSNSISILHLISGVDPVLLTRRKKHLTSMQCGESINFPQAFEDLVGLLRSKLPH
jgi:hypothetical protein